MKIKMVSGVMVTLLLISTIPLSFHIQPVNAESTTWTVDDDLLDYPAADFTKIQDAVNVATDGDTIIVYPGTYLENINVNKSISIGSASGAEVTIVQGSNPEYHNINVTADGVTITGFTVAPPTEFSYRSGIYLAEVSFCNISNNNINGLVATWTGIHLDNSMNNIIRKNNVSNYYDNINLHHSRNNTITENIVSNSVYRGLSISDNSDNNTIKNNIFLNDGAIVANSYQNTIEDNSVNGKPLVYLEDESDYIINYAGQVILVNCKNITVKNLNIDPTCVGIELWGTNYSKIMNNKVNGSYLNSFYGIYLGTSNNNLISENDIPIGNYVGIKLEVSNNNTIVKNNISTIFYDGIRLSQSLYNILSNNTLFGNAHGIELDGSPHNTLTDNVIQDTTHASLDVDGWKLSDFIQNIDTSNTINGKPLYYWINKQNEQIPSDAGYVGIVNCTKISVNKLNLSNNGQGILLAYTNYSRIEKVNLSWNYEGIVLSHSFHNTITKSVLKSNRRHGISFADSSDNNIYLNNFNNFSNINSVGSSNNTWRSPGEITYNYTDTIHTTYMGNYWDDYEGTDADGDGIGDIFYSIGEDKDNYPLMEPFENYTILLALNADKSSYIQGEKVCLTATTTPYTDVSFEVDYPNTTIHSLYTNQSDASGMSTYSFYLEEIAPIGTYTAFASTAQATASTTFDVTAAPDTTPPQITGLAHSPTDPQPTDTVTIMADILDSESNITSVTLYYSTDGGSNWNGQTMTGDDSLYSTTIGPFTHGTTIQYYVNATNDEDLSALSSTQSFLVQDTLGPSLSNLAYDPDQPTTEQTVTVSVDVLDLGSGIQNVILFTSSDGGTAWTANPMSGSSSIYSATVGPFDVGIIQYYVNATDNVGNSQVSSTQSFSVVEPNITLNMSLAGTPTPGGAIQANIQITNTFNTSKSILVVIQVLDPNGIPLAPVYQWITVEAYSVQDITLTVTIPVIAQQGSYLVQGQLLTDFPRNGGYAVDYQEQTIIVS